MAAKSSTSMTPNYESCPYLIKLHFQLWEFLIFSQITYFYYQKGFQSVTP